MPVWANALATAVISGVITASVAYAGHFGAVTSTRYLVGFLVGAGVGLVNWWRTPPHQMTR
jgi:hypothetical protein